MTLGEGDPPESGDGRFKYNHTCTGCDGSYADCQPLWKEQRVCCPDCDHTKAHPPKETWQERQAEVEAEHDVQLEAGHA